MAFGKSLGVQGADAEKWVDITSIFWPVAIYPAGRDHATLTESKILAISPVFSYLDQCLILRA